MLATEIVTPSVERQKKYYVYTLAYPDGTVFYVGKGTVRQRKDRLFTSDTRMEDHEQEARRGVKSPKCEIIRKIWASGDQVCKSKVFETDDELEALKYEQALIWQFSESGHLANAESYNLNQIMSISDIPDHQILSSEVAQEEEKYLTVKKACDFLGVKCKVDSAGTYYEI